MQSRSVSFPWMIVPVVMYGIFFIWAALVLMLVEFFAEKSAPNAALLINAYAAGILAFTSTRGIFMELATTDKLGEVPSKFASQAIRWVGIAFTVFPHAIALSWAAWFMGDVATFPHPGVFGIGMAMMMLMTHFRSRRKSLRTFSPRQFSQALDIDFHDPVYMEVLTDIDKDDMMEAVKKLRIHKGANLIEAIHTVRKIRYNKGVAMPQDDGL